MEHLHSSKMVTAKCHHVHFHICLSQSASRIFPSPFYFTLLCVIVLSIMRITSNCDCS